MNIKEEILGKVFTPARAENIGKAKFLRSFVEAFKEDAEIFGLDEAAELYSIYGIDKKYLIKNHKFINECVKNTSNKLYEAVTSEDKNLLLEKKGEDEYRADELANAEIGKRIQAKMDKAEGNRKMENLVANGRQSPPIAQSPQAANLKTPNQWEAADMKEEAEIKQALTKAAPDAKKYVQEADPENAEQTKKTLEAFVKTPNKDIKVPGATTVPGAAAANKVGFLQGIWNSIKGFFGGIFNMKNVNSIGASLQKGTSGIPDLIGNPLVKTALGVGGVGLALAVISKLRKTAQAKKMATAKA